MRYFKSLRFLIYVAVVGVALALLERHQASTYAHLAAGPDPKGKPELQGESLRDLATVLFELYPEEAEPNLVMGKALAEQGKLQEARAYFEKSLEIDRNKQALLFLYARLLLDLDEDPQQIRAVVDEIRRNFPRSKEKVEEYFMRASSGKIRFDRQESGSQESGSQKSGSQSSDY